MGKKKKKGKAPVTQEQKDAMESKAMEIAKVKNAPPMPVIEPESFFEKNKMPIIIGSGVLVALVGVGVFLKLRSSSAVT